MKEIHHISEQEIQAKLNFILDSPKNNGTLKLIVTRPIEDDRQILDEGEITFSEGLKGDSWNQRSSRHTPDKSPYIENQLTIMNARVIDTITKSSERWPLAGDQLFVDFDLSEDNLPAGSKILIGNAILEVSVIPHNGCGKFKARFGSDALKFVNSPFGKENHFRGVNAKVIKEGKIKKGDLITKITN